MFISVDLPAPFSPRSACTSFRRRSKSTWSFARTPGKRLVMPRSSRVGRDEVLRVVDQDLRSGHCLLRAVTVTGDPDVDGRDLDPSDGTDDLLAHLLRHLRGEHADQAARLVRGVGQAFDVLEERVPRLVR